MNSGLGKSISYWAKNNPKQIWWLLLALAASLFRGQILMEMIAVVIISIRTVDVFNVMTYSLPFSRKDIWKMHVVVETLVFGLYLCIKIIQNTDSMWTILLQIFFVLFAYCNCLRLPRRKEHWWIGILPMIIAVVFIIWVDCAPQIRLLLEGIATNKYACGIFGFVDLLMIFINVLTWKKEYRLFVKGDIHD